MRPLALLIAAALLASPVAAFAQTSPHVPQSGGEETSAEDPNNLMQIDLDDVQMNAARAEARRTLPNFWTRFDNDPEVRETAVLKMKFTAKDGTVEIMWVRQLTRSNGVVTGLLDNEPTTDVGVKLGGPVTVDLSKVVDWGYYRGDIRWGFFTSRVMLARLPAETAAQLGAETYSPTPIEP